jgi:hypothetical protein
MVDDAALRAELQKLLQKHEHAHPSDPETMTISEFCALEKISKPYFYKLKRRDLAPKVSRLPGLSKLRITRDARNEWRKAMDRRAQAEARTPEFKIREQKRIEQRHAAVASRWRKAKAQRP